MTEEPTNPAPENLEVLLDGRLVKLPAERRSLSAIRTYLETLALENDRVLCSFSVDGDTANLPWCGEKISFTRVEGQTVVLTQMPRRMLETAYKETTSARSAVEAAVTLVLINNGDVARELWWNLARRLKEPLLTLSLLPESLYHAAPGCASLSQMRRWQLQQLATIMENVDAACYSTDPAALSNALETHVLPWLDKLEQNIHLWHETVLAGTHLQSNWDRDVDQRSLAGA